VNEYSYSITDTVNNKYIKGKFRDQIPPISAAIATSD
jgi:hypothetical protein